ncbi:glycosyltransferase family 4 protein, partial [Bacteroides sp. OttesenSCG-928-F21]|nr:glycosyltransferase family 4 protein [Bacteroides sp. OttesenSCG-928-F21]
SYMKDIQHLSVPIKERIKFTGFVPYEEVPKFLSIADIAIVPSLWEEPFALTCAEAMAMGVPLIISNSGGMSEVVDANCAIIFDKTGDIPKNIRDGILELYNDNSKREKMSKAALKRAQLFSKEVYAERITSLLSVKSI